MPVPMGLPRHLQDLTFYMGDAKSQHVCLQNNGAFRSLERDFEIVHAKRTLDLQQNFALFWSHSSSNWQNSEGQRFFVFSVSE
jgi:hypothetical protein